MQKEWQYKYMNKIKLKLFNYLMKNLFNTVTEDQILKIYNNKVTIGNVELSEKDVRGLKSEAITIQSLPLWQYLTGSMKYIANKRMYNDSKSIEDLIAGKMILFTLEVMEKKIDNIKNIKV